ncbi:MAG: hypothetical protein AAGD47_09370 [Pseudomonadota bacterium]
MVLIDRSLWPDTVRNPLKQLVFAIFAAPFIWGVVCTVLAFIIAGLTEPDLDGTLVLTQRFLVISFGACYAFTLTLGVLGVIILLLAKVRNIVVWAFTGGMMGGLVAVAHMLMLPGQMTRAILIAFVILGWSIFLTIRSFAKIRGD